MKKILKKISDLFSLERRTDLKVQVYTEEVEKLAQDVTDLAKAVNSLAKIVGIHHSMLHENAVANATIAKVITKDSVVDLPELNNTKNEKPN